MSTDKTYALKCKMIKEIFKIYNNQNRLNNIMDFQKTLSIGLSAEMCKYTEHFATNKEMLDKVMSQLDSKHSWILQNIFIKKNQNRKNWYQDYFSRSTFFKLKKEAINEFINLYFVGQFPQSCI
ncbi:hypothetical protein V2E24_02275 [Mycoplasmopsis ciconiae]|uniref:Uncharacterized protein n=1 Tax=Mycoplasmopsis ciconiae TaxID=561067 RepID=A0ABU7MLJ1_9BACT|nr:hypothetical protein [Mycoplasmopsis ciconiae]